MNISYLKTLLVVRETGSFLEASGILNLSHSAISVQMRRLEEHLSRDLFRKGKRPAQLTPFGAKFCDMAVPVVTDYDRLMHTTAEDSTDGLIRIGFVSTTLQTLLPIVLNRLAQNFENLAVNAVSGLSDELARKVEAEELDFAFVSAPTAVAGNLRLIEFAREPLRIIAPKNLPDPADPMDLLADMPFIGFARSTWLGSQIHTTLLEIGLKVNQTVELDSIDAIENLVEHGVGVSVVPQRIFAIDLGAKMKCLDFPLRNNQRVLSLIAHRRNNRKTILSALADISRHRYRAD